MKRTVLMRSIVCGLIAAASFTLTGCATVPETGRQRVILTSPDQEAKLGVDAYKTMLDKEKVVESGPDVEAIRRVGTRLASVVPEGDYAWEFNLIESDQKNAFALPGGKVAVYTGILPVLKNEAGLAAVLGHEIAHVTARHGGERLTQSVGIKVVQEAAAYGLGGQSAIVQKGAMGALGLGLQVGAALPFSREHELEADHIGVLYAARAGYDPREAVGVWQRMDEAGKRAPEFLSTHPNPGSRVEQLNQLMPQALAEYENAPTKHGIGEAQW